MSRKKLNLLALPVIFCLVISLVTPASAASGRSAAVISAALGEMGVTEGRREDTKYGTWYGLPNDYWCDMFVSWCANKAGISRTAFPIGASCTLHANKFKQLGRFQSSAYRGGSYTPRQGDLIFFSGATSNTPHHVGLVLYVENGQVFSIEGNALTNRMDFPYSTISALRNSSQDPPDYVTVNNYPLNYNRIYGYGLPDYADRSAIELTGYIDLPGKFSDSSYKFLALAEAGIMAGTSSHTFTPRGGMTRGDFTQSLMKIFGLSGWSDDTRAFTDVPASNPNYNAIMTARSYGITEGIDGQKYEPGIYISAASAQRMISNTLSVVGLPDNRTFSFPAGDMSHTCNSPYVTRASIGEALYQLMTERPDILPAFAPRFESFTGTLYAYGAAMDWPARVENDVCYVEMNTFVNWAGKLGLIPYDPTNELPVALIRQQEQDNPSTAITHTTASIQMFDRLAPVPAIRYKDLTYIKLASAADWLGVNIQIQDADSTQPVIPGGNASNPPYDYTPPASSGGNAPSVSVPVNQQPWYVSPAESGGEYPIDPETESARRDQYLAGNTWAIPSYSGLYYD